MQRLVLARRIFRIFIFSLSQYRCHRLEKLAHSGCGVRTVCVNLKDALQASHISKTCYASCGVPVVFEFGPHTGNLGIADECV